MKFKNLRYKIGNSIYEPREIIRTEGEGGFFFLEANKEYSLEGVIRNETVRCPIELVEVEEIGNAES